MIIVLLGLADDRWELDAPTKMAGQVLAAAVMALQGITLLWLPIDGVLVLDPTTSVLLTVLIVLISVNAINFIDGLDGLAAGITMVSAAAFFVYGYLLRSSSAWSAPRCRPSCRRSWSACASGSCPTTCSRPGCSWATPGPC